MEGGCGACGAPPPFCSGPKGRAVAASAAAGVRCALFATAGAGEALVALQVVPASLPPARPERRDEKGRSWSCPSGAAPC